jgi:hypothetical protein
MVKKNGRAHLIAGVEMFQEETENNVELLTVHYDHPHVLVLCIMTL